MTGRTAVARKERRAVTTDVAALWDAYGSSRDVETRERLVLHYAGLLTFVASRVGAELPSSIDFGDLIQSGAIGLMDAVERFEPNRGLKFETYAVARIRGAMVDELRALDWAPRSVRAKARELDSAARASQARLNRTPTNADLAQELGVSAIEVQRRLAAVSRTQVHALEELMGDSDGSGQSVGDTLTDPLAELPGDRFEARAEHSAVRAALNELPARERAVLVHTFVDGLTLRQTGELLDVSESRASQIRTKALARLRELLDGRVGG